MIVGRTVFGFGGEGLQVAQSTIISHHFKGSELAFAMGIQLSVARGGSVLAFNIAPHLASTYNVLTPLYLGVAICGLGVLAAILLIPLISIVKPKLSTKQQRVKRFKKTRKVRRISWMQLRSVYVGILAHHSQLCNNYGGGPFNSIGPFGFESFVFRRTVLSETRVVLRGSRAGRVTRRAALECAVDHVRYIGTVHRCSLRCCRIQSEFRSHVRTSHDGCTHFSLSCHSAADPLIGMLLRCWV